MVTRMSLEQLGQDLQKNPDRFEIPTGRPRLTLEDRVHQKASYCDRADICRVLAKYLICLRVNFHIDCGSTTQWIKSVGIDADGNLEFGYDKMTFSEFNEVDHITMLLRMADSYDEAVECIESVEPIFHNVDVDYEASDFQGWTHKP
jgi:hypothetical protein